MINRIFRTGLTVIVSTLASLNASAQKMVSQAEMALSSSQSGALIAELKEQAFKLKEQNYLLGEQLKMTQNFHTSIMDTVFWGLSALIASATILLAVNYFTALRMRVGDRQSLASEFENKVALLAKDLSDQNAVKNQALTEGINQRTDSLLDRIGQDFNAIRQEIATDKNFASAVIGELRVHIDILKTEAIELRYKNMLMSNTLDFLELSQKRFEANHYKERKSNLLLLMTEAQLVAAAIRTGSRPMLDGALKDLEKTIMTHFSGANATAVSKETIEYVLKHLSADSKNAELQAHVISLVQSMPVKSEDAVE